MFIRSVRMLALCLVAGCAAASPDPHVSSMAGGDLSSSELAVDDLGTTPPPPPPAKMLDMTVTMPAPSPDLAMTPPDMAQPRDLGPFPEGQFYEISVKSDGQLLSVRNQSTLNGSVTEEQPSHGTPDQRWTLQLVDSGYRIINGQSGTCLDVAGSSTADSAATGIYTCSASLSQEWTLTPVTGTNFYNIVNVNSKSCIDLDNAGTTPGTQIFQYHCNGGDNQKWFFTAVQ
ncbi:MAG TPA: RICIN domain-containing protein [Polyangia bacterium]|nr:RICIN domain-containing protein [Polyangia bacterium]